jgi:hypothetical protein
MDAAKTLTGYIRYIGPTSERLGLTSERLGLTSERLGLTSERLGPTSERLRVGEPARWRATLGARHRSLRNVVWSYQT